MNTAVRKILGIVTLVAAVAIIGLLALGNFLPTTHAGWPGLEPLASAALVGGRCVRGSPTVADVDPSLPGLEVVVGACVDHGNPASVAMFSYSTAVGFTKRWETFDYWGNAIGSVSTPAVGDIDNDGDMEIVIGMGGWTTSPVTRGGVLALERDGNPKWYRQTYDVDYPNPSGGPDGIPDGVYASPSIADVDGDGKNEVIFGGGDHHLWVVDGATGQPEAGFPLDMLDTIFSSTAVADLDGDNVLDYTFGADLNLAIHPECGTSGGVMRAMRGNGTYPPGWNLYPTSCTWIPQGKWVEQVLWSSPAIGDVNRDGTLEIIMGSGPFYSASVLGHWVKVWRADSRDEIATLSTDGVVDAAPALADLNSDGYLDIIVGDSPRTDQWQFNGTGALYAWSGKDFSKLWGPVKIGLYPNYPTAGAVGSPVVADIDPTQPGPEILLGFGNEVAVFSAAGTQLTDTGSGGTTLLMGGWTENSPAVADLDNDGYLEIVVAGQYCTDYSSCNSDYRQSVVAWRWPTAIDNATTAYKPWPMFRKDAAHHAYYAIPTLGVSPASVGYLYKWGSGDPNPSGQLIVRNDGELGDISYTLSYSSYILSLSGPTSGAIAPLSSIDFPFVISASSQITGTYDFGFNVQATDSLGLPAANSPQQVNGRLAVGDFLQTYLPMIMKNN
jgi:hypothetical protein